MVVDGPRSAGGVQERSAHTTFLSGVTSMACTGAVLGSSLSDHWLNHSLMMVFPLGRRVAVCTLVNLYSGVSAAVHSQTVSPWRLISRTNLSPLPAIRMFPFASGVADQQLGSSCDQSTLPSRLYSTTFRASMCADRKSTRLNSS